MLLPHAIYTASDRKHGDFLIEHWYRSLHDNVDLTGIEVRVLDYGLSMAQRYYLSHQGARVVPCERNGHPAVIRFRDIARDLASNPADQVLACDGGDIIFQSDISGLFREHTEAFRAVSEAVLSSNEVFLSEEFFSRPRLKLLREQLAGKPQINAGFLLGPAARFANLCRRVHRSIRRHDKFGPDQLAVNGILHSEGWIELDRGYNFVVTTADRAFEIRRGVFVFEDGSRIPVVHNAGNWSFLRPVRQFGYGRDRNQLRTEILQTLRLVHHSASFLLETRESWNRFTSRAWSRAWNRIRRLKTAIGR